MYFTVFHTSIQSLYFRFNNVDNCHISDVNLRFAGPNIEDILSDPNWDLYRQEDTSECSASFGGSGGKLPVKKQGPLPSH